jgi:hypothetical protein
MSVVESGVAQKTLFDANLSVSEAQAIIDLHGVDCVNSVRDAKTRFSPSDDGVAFARDRASVD